MRAPDEADAAALRSTGRRLRDARLRRGLTVAEAAAKVGMPEVRLRDIETGTWPSTLDELVGLSLALGMAPEELNPDGHPPGR